jgi:hypothetical protein
MIVNPQVPFEPDDLQIWNWVRGSQGFLSLYLIMKRNQSYFAHRRTCARTIERNDTFRIAHGVSRIRCSRDATRLSVMP